MRCIRTNPRYYKYTGDAELLIKHLSKIEGIAWLLSQRRAAAIRAYPNASDSRHGMPTGNDEADLFWRTVTGDAGTELPFISIGGCAGCASPPFPSLYRTCGRGRGILMSSRGRGYLLLLLLPLRRRLSQLQSDTVICHPPRTSATASEMWRGFRDLGEALTAISRTPAGATHPALATLGTNLTDQAVPLLAQLRKSMAADAFAMAPGAARCFPYVAGTLECGMISPEASNRDR